MVEVHPLSPTIGAEITDVDLRALDESDGLDLRVSVSNHPAGSVGRLRELQTGRRAPHDGPGGRG